MGGDGTVHQAVNAIAPYPTRPCLGIIPTGTVNNFARALGISPDSEKAIAQMSFEQKRKIDVGKMNDTYFVSTVAAGSIPQSVQQVDAAAKTKFGPFAYLFEGAKALNDDSAPRFELTLDDKRLTVQFSMILVAVTHSVAGIETFFPSATPDDGKLHFMGLRETSALKKLSLVPEIFKADKENSEHLVIVSFENGHLTAPIDESLMCTIDGESGLSFPIDLSVLPRFLCVYSPAG
ncbi:diacylglycerol/lipid kinase family protein [Atopococcus tabaci]|uniref:diacylglycerol/lipid kinase family protein n=1 Tax=Atopococcus tabaci TaxID=269774 RepID=UPI00240A6E00|nr:diacylglycerol kinase family protein [Atopococcus tabaci]